MVVSVPVLLPSPQSRVRVHPPQRPDANPNTPHINHILPFTYAFMIADTAGSFPRSHIDLTLDRQTRRRLRKSAGRSGGVFQVTHDATRPWDLEYINQYEFHNHFFLQREAQPFSFSDDNGDNEQDDEANTMLSTPQRHLDNADTTHKDDPDHDDHDPSVETPVPKSSPNSSNTDMEERTLLSALPPRLNLRKVSGQSTPDTHFELQSSVTQRRQKGVTLRSEQVSNPMQTSQPSTAQLRSNMESLAKYIEEKLQLYGARSKGKPAPGFLTIHPQPSEIGSLQTQYRAHGVYNNKRAGVSEFSLDDQSALQKVTDFDKQAKPHRGSSVPCNRAKAKSVSLGS